MSFLEKHKNPDTFPTRATGLNSMNAYFKQNGLRLGKIIGEVDYFYFICELYMIVN